MTKKITGSGGKGGGGSSFKEADNSLRSNTYVSALEALSWGPILGLTNGMKSVYLDNTPLVASDGKSNYPTILASADIRYGDAVQTVIKGFENTGTPFDVSTAVTQPLPVTRTVSSSTVDAIELTVSLPNGLYNQRTDGKGIDPTSVELNVFTKLSSGSWAATPSAVIKYSDKTTSPYKETFRIQRPTGSGVWDFKVVRVTPDSSTSNLRDATTVSYFVEIQAETISYPNIALLGLTVDASSTATSTEPVRSAETFGIICSIPTNLNEYSRVFTGTWDGTLKQGWTNDPAWVLYYILTNEDVGLGLDPADIDVTSFYEASVYNSVQLSFTNRAGVAKSSARFSFDYQILQGEQAPALANRIASTMNAKLIHVDGQVRLIQDRPDTPELGFTEGNVIDGKFTVFTSDIDGRQTAVNVTWIDPDNNYSPVTTNVTAADIGSTAMNQLGYEVANLAAYGCTRESQAIRYGKWYLENALNTTQMVSFKTGIIGSTLVPGQIIKVFNSANAGFQNAGRLLSGSTTTSIKLDRAITLTAGSTIDIFNQDGTVFLNKAITTTGSASTITLTTALSAAPAQDSVFMITTNGISPELYRVMSVKRAGNNEYEVIGNFYDPNRYARVEGGVVLPAPKYSGLNIAVPQKIQNLVVTEVSTYINLSIQRVLRLSWDAQSNVKGYRVGYGYGGNLSSEDINLNSFEIPLDQIGQMSYAVTAVNAAGMVSAPVIGRFTVAATETPGSALSAPELLYIEGTTGTTSSTKDFIFTFGNPASNGSKTTQLSRFKMSIYDSTGTTMLRTKYIDPIDPGSKASAIYAFDENVLDGGPRRSIQVAVQAQDIGMKLSTVNQKTFTNSAPSVPSNISFTASQYSIYFECDKPAVSDYRGIQIFGSTVSGFAPGPANLLHDGGCSASITAVLGTKLVAGTTYYFKVAAYDEFGTDSLTYSTQLSATPAAISFGELSGFLSTGQIPASSIDATKFAASIKPVEVVTSLPTTGNVQGRMVFLTADSKLYRYTGSAWTTAISTADLAGQITSTQITDDAITTPKIAAGAVTADELAVNSVIAGKIAAGAVSATEIAANAITAKHLLVADLTNLCPNGKGDSLDGWYPGVAGGVSLDYLESYWTPVGVSSRNTLTFKNRDTTFGQPFNVVPGDQFLCSMDTVTFGAGASTYSFGIGLAFQDATSQATGGYTQWGFGALRAVGTAGYQNISGTLTVPAGVTRATAWVQIGCANGVLLSGLGEVHHGTNLTIRRKASSSLIVDGAVVASKIGTNAIQANHIQAGIIISTHIATLGITADKIDTRNLTIKDGSGNVIFGSGTNLDFGRVNASPGWLNSQITVDNNGYLSGAGSSVQVNNSALAQYGNLLVNTGNNSNENFHAKGWTFSNSGITSYQYYTGLTTWPAGEWFPTGTNPFALYSDATGTPASNYTQLVSDSIPVVPGERYEFSVYIQSHRAHTHSYIVWYDKDGAGVSGTLSSGYAGEWALSPPAAYGGSGTAKDLGQWKRLGTFGTAPPGAVAAKMILRKFATLTGYADSYAWFILPYFGKAGSTQTVLSPYASGSEWIPTGTVRPANPITAPNVTTYIASAAIGSLQIADASIANAKIANLAVTGAKISDLTVDTLKIANNAVTVPSSVVVPTWAGTGDTPVSNSYMDTLWGQVYESNDLLLCSVVISTSGAPVTILSSCGRMPAHVWNGYTSGSSRLRLFRDGVLIAEGQHGAWGVHGIDRVLNWRDQPSAGTHTYALYFRYGLTTPNTMPFGTNTQGYCTNAAIITLETKK